MSTLVLTVHILLAFVLVGLVLLQQGKGADAGAVIGGGANTLFGVGGASTLLVKLTTGVAIAFMLTSVLLVRLAAVGAGTPQGGEDGSTADALRGSVWEGALAPTAAPTAFPAVAAVGTGTAGIETPVAGVTGVSTGVVQESSGTVAPASAGAPVVPAIVPPPGGAAPSGSVPTTFDADSAVPTPAAQGEVGKVQPTTKSDGKKKSAGGKSSSGKATVAKAGERKTDGKPGR
jgi:preprotein translocase subunit SecG